KTSWPDVTTSARLAWRNLRFGWINPRFGLTTAVVYLLVAWAVAANLPRTPDLGIVRATLRALVQGPGAGMLILSLVGAFVLFTDRHSKVQRYVGGVLHAGAHIAAIFAIGWSAHAALAGHDGPLAALAKGVLVAAGGYLIGPIVMGLYLLISLNWRS